ncbi:GNAT family acetyltransferase [Capsaspora owczarzaki ATCC 30864]|uniref:GNAT family acetyltransferase n=1 Tax=Capsaspora owczarzaki (strain ATCC 30864) TaxID=595528 RepID=A0A0D2X564_CAPO3|nr:GNAT family acetyltransferase [Capsaspora owczarzaki ATCC 30864]KJE97264.1 GNAT family acetyltransferase [Capsaspora owczarzaki ATCC 30864]|eukprot:XP_004343575.1 GNAT family acetyltransferase [Capsaspora owczarzaki ATCC 30864]
MVDDWGQAKLPAPDTTLEGAYCRLRPLELERDVPVLFAETHGDATKAAVWTYMKYGPWETAEAMQAHYALLKPATQLMLIVESKQSGKIVGSISYMTMEPNDRSIELGSIFYFASAQRTEANTEAAYLLARHAIEVLGYRRVEWKANALNAKSRKSAARMGFVYEGILRSKCITKGNNRDTIYFSMLEDEWYASRKANYEKWLYQNATPRISLAELNGNLYAGPEPVTAAAAAAFQPTRAGAVSYVSPNGLTVLGAAATMTASPLPSGSPSTPASAGDASDSSAVLARLRALEQELTALKQKVLGGQA